MCWVEISEPGLCDLKIEFVLGQMEVDLVKELVSYHGCWILDEWRVRGVQVLAAFGYIFDRGVGGSFPSAFAFSPW